MEKVSRGARMAVSRAVEMELLQEKINSYSDMLYRIAFCGLGITRTQRMSYKRHLSIYKESEGI